jgi:acetate kinase
LAFLGVESDPRQKLSADGDAAVTAPRARAASIVIAAREDLEIAAQVRTTIQ